MMVREWKIAVIREHWYYETGSLETMTDAEIDGIFEKLLDWMEA